MVLLVLLQGCYVICYLEDQAKNIATRVGPSPGSTATSVTSGQYCARWAICI